MSDERVVDLSRRSARTWLPRVDDFGRPTEARLYVELVRSAGLRLGVALDGTPHLTVHDGANSGGTRVLKVPSPELMAYLDSFRLRRGQALLDQEVSERFVRLVKARCASPDFVPEGRHAPPPPAEILARAPPTTEYEEVRELVRRLADPTIVEAFIRHRSRLSAETGLRILTVPVGPGGRVFVLERSDRLEGSPDRGPGPTSGAEEPPAGSREAARRRSDR